MGLDKQYNVTHKARQFFGQIYDTRTKRAGLLPDTDLWYCAPAGGWNVSGWVNGPVTFVLMEDNAGMTFTGWSKFDYEGQWSEQNGICRAIQKAVEAYIAYQFEQVTEELSNSKWGSGEVMDLPNTLEETCHEVPIDSSPTQTDRDNQVS